MRRRRLTAAEKECLALARRLARRPCNRDGADKTWVVEVIEDMNRFFSSARLLPIDKRHARLR